MAYIKLNKTGCEERKGNVKLRLDFYLNPEDPRYDDRYLYLVDVTSPEYLAGYQGKVDEEGNPVDQEDYNKWWDALPRIWENTPLHSHFVYFDSDVTIDDIKAQMEFHLPNFYKAFQERRDEVNGGMRHGWATEKRIKPTDYSKSESIEDYDARVAECQAKIDELTEFSYKPKGEVVGQEFPATEIDVGPGAIDRLSNWTIPGFTLVDINNPANDTGTIDTFEVWASFYDMENTKVGTFHGSGTAYTNRDGEAIGTVAFGAKRTFTGLDIDVSTGDFVGTYYTAGRIERATTGFLGFYYLSGDQFGTGEQTYAVATDDAISLYGTGETVGAFDVNLTDGLEVGDTSLRSMLAGLSLTDGLSSGDAQAPFGMVSMADGVELGDSILRSLVTQLLVTAGLKIGDSVGHHRDISDARLCAGWNGIAEFEDVTAFAYRTYPSGPDKVHIESYDGVKDFTIPSCTATLGCPFLALLTSKTKLWIAYEDRSVAVKVDEYTIGESSLSLDSSKSLGDEDSRVHGFIKLPSGKFIIARKQHDWKASGTYEMYFDYSNDYSTWYNVEYDITGAGNLAMSGNICEHPDGSVWFFHYKDGIGEIGVINLAEDGSSLSIDWYDDEYITEEDVDEDLRPHGEKPFLSAVADPSTSSILLAYQNDYAVFINEKWATKMTVAKCVSSSSRTALLVTDDYMERINNIEIGFVDGTLWLAYAKMLMEEADAWEANDLTFLKSSVATYMGELRGGIQAASGIRMNHSSKYLIAGMDGNFIRMFTLKGSPLVESSSSLSSTDGAELGDIRSLLAGLTLSDGMEIGEGETEFRYEHYIAGDSTYLTSQGTTWRGQSYTPLEAHTITKVKLKLLRVGSPGTLTVSIRATDGGGHPTGGDLCSGTTDGDTLTTDYAGEWREITFGAGYALSASTKYAIVIRALSGDTNNYCCWRTDTTDPTYPGGCVEVSHNSGSSWSSQSTRDFMFEEYGIKITPLIEMLAAISISSGIELGDLTITALALHQIMTDGFKLGDTATLIQAIHLQLSDGASVGDTSVVEMLANIVHSEGINLGDNASLIAALVYMAIADGLKVGDTSLVGKIVEAQLSDGTKIGDSLSAEMVANLLSSDGMNLGDVLLIASAISLIITDGLEAGDVRLLTFLANLAIEEGVVLEDTALYESTSAVIYLAISQGISMGDAPALTMLAVLSILEAIRLGDTRSAGYLTELLTLWLYTKPHHVVTPFTEPYHYVRLWTGGKT